MESALRKKRLQVVDRGKRRLVTEPMMGAVGARVGACVGVGGAAAPHTHGQPEEEDRQGTSCGLQYDPPFESSARRPPLPKPARRQRARQWHHQDGRPHSHPRQQHEQGLRSGPRVEVFKGWARGVWLRLTIHNHDHRGG